MYWKRISAKKKILDSFRPLLPALVENLEQWFLIELTYTSNAIEGNTLTRRETAVVVEKGLTVSGKSLVEHLEAANHAKALQGVMKLIGGKTSDLSERDVLSIHNTILKGIDDESAGHYRSIPARISGSEVILPNYRKVPDLMDRFINEMNSSDLHPVELAAEAHYQLVTIHPFVDGNGRTARLLMNLILMQQGYPPALIRKRDRLKYIKSLEQAQLGGSKEDYYKIIADAVNRSLDIYLSAVSDDQTFVAQSKLADDKLLKIGALSKATGESNATIRFWTKEGLLEVADTTAASYQLYSPTMIERVRRIRKLQSQRFALKEIKEKV